MTAAVAVAVAAKCTQNSSSMQQDFCCFAAAMAYVTLPGPITATLPFPPSAITLALFCVPAHPPRTEVIVGNSANFVAGFVAAAAAASHILPRPYYMHALCDIAHIYIRLPPAPHRPPACYLPIETGVITSAPFSQQRLISPHSAAKNKVRNMRN